MANKYQFADDFEELCKKYGYTGTAVVKETPDSDDFFAWSVQEDDDSLNENLDLQMTTIKSGIEGVYSCFGNEEFELATKTIADLVCDCGRKRYGFVQWILGLKQYVQTEEGKKYLNELLKEAKY